MMNKYIKKIALLCIAGFFAAIFSGCGSAQTYKVDLEIWGPLDDSTTYGEIINQYKKINPYAGEIKYRKFSQDSYKQELLDALASGQGPDIFLINNSWEPSFENKIEPAPILVTNSKEFQSNFPDAVSFDFVNEGRIYGAPLSVDSLALYYNKDMFNAAGITYPPKTWDEFNNAVKRLTILNTSGQFVQSGAAMGTQRNINRAADVLEMLMFQNGVTMPQRGMEAKFDQGVANPDGSVTMAGAEALNYYTQFARLSLDGFGQNPLYAWNNSNHYSIDAFSEGSLAMMFNFSWQVKTINNMNPKLNFGVAPIPQVRSDRPANVANYWSFVVSKNKTAPTQQVAGQQQATPVPNAVRVHEAWQFIKFLTMKNSGTVKLVNALTKNSKDFAIAYDPALEYLKKTAQPAARRDIIESQKDDPVFGPFASGNLIAKSWFQKNPEKAEYFMLNAIDEVTVNGKNFREVLKSLSNSVNLSSN